MIKLDKILQQELTRKQFVVSTVSAFVGLLGISTFLGAFTKNIEKRPERPGYGDQGYGP
ncbi:MAG TPA: hypothetical protein VLF40_04175 [Candidatus Saccharimonadales bacterium]|nr:hypothetical protein [Candidatus Saccharimonadales bacterium]